jgi:hypothetical protein
VCGTGGPAAVVEGEEPAVAVVKQLTRPRSRRSRAGRKLWGKRRWRVRRIERAAAAEAAGRRWRMLG